MRFRDSYAGFQRLVLPNGVTLLCSGATTGVMVLLLAGRRGSFLLAVTLFWLVRCSKYLVSVRAPKPVGGATSACRAVARI
jgi:hypothetical protein